MRGEYRYMGQHITSAGQAMAVLDLALAGVKAEMADTVLDWSIAPGMVSAAAPSAGHDTSRRQIPAVLPKVLSAGDPLKDAPAAKRIAAPPAEPAGEAWVEGEGGGVLLVVQGGMPDGRAQALARAMLAAAGIHDMPLCWVGYHGGGRAVDLREAMRAKAPRRVLVLGQAPLGVLLGRNLGVEGWHAAGTGKIEGWDEAPVGVTYPLDLLLKQPLFKRLAWQHLQAWGHIEV